MRKGSRRISDIPNNIIKDLNDGKIESANLVESLAVDFNKLSKSIGLNAYCKDEIGIIKKMQYFGDHIDDWQEFKNHQSDNVRGWCAFSLGQKNNLTFSDRLQKMLHFADDRHFGVREWSWISLRRSLIDNLEEGINLLTHLTNHKSENIRRFACEIARPRGVWCKHIIKLKKNPQLAIDILENLKTDDGKYVRNSLGNWLNDAAKDNENWVVNLCKKWNQTHNANTKHIIKRGLRNVTK